MQLAVSPFLMETLQMVGLHLVSCLLLLLGLIGLVVVIRRSCIGIVFILSYWHRVDYRRWVVWVVGPWCYVLRTFKNSFHSIVQVLIKSFAVTSNHNTKHPSFKTSTALVLRTPRVHHSQRQIVFV